MTKAVLPMPPHPAVNWGSVSREAGRAATIEVTCPHCRRTRRDLARQVAYRIKKGSYSGYCYQDRLLHTTRARTIRITHPTLDWSQQGIKQGTRGRFATVLFTCQRCGAQSRRAIHTVQAQLRKGLFTGYCPPCSLDARGERKNPTGRTIEAGYVRLSRWAIPQEDRWLFDAMGEMVREHRMVMAKALGRPLEAYELVDHMNGNGTDNALENLRLYVRGKNQPGSHNGSGTYYHEWQMAEARIRRLLAHS